MDALARWSLLLNCSIWDTKQIGLFLQGLQSSSSLTTPDIVGVVDSKKMQSIDDLVGVYTRGSLPFGEQSSVRHSKLLLGGCRRDRGRLLGHCTSE